MIMIIIIIVSKCERNREKQTENGRALNKDQTERKKRNEIEDGGSTIASDMPKRKTRSENRSQKESTSTRKKR
jgi:hypothetical protein